MLNIGLMAQPDCTQPEKGIDWHGGHGCAFGQSDHGAEANPRTLVCAEEGAGQNNAHCMKGRV
jgi:hypothetical protein